MTNSSYLGIKKVQARLKITMSCVSLALKNPTLTDATVFPLKGDKNVFKLNITGGTIFFEKHIFMLNLMRANI